MMNESPVLRRRGTGRFLLVLVAFAIILIGQRTYAQLSYSSGRPVWPAYEGWMQNADGTADFLFGYMNENWQEELDVPVGPDYAKTASDKVELDNKNCRFEPHVALMRTTQTLVLKNSDPAPVSHNTNIAPLINAGINPVLAAGGDPIEHKFDSEEGLPIKIGCNIHPWMGAWLIVRKDPYAAVSEKTGAFTIKDLPVGKELEFVLWQEKSGYLKNATFKGGKADTKGRFKLKLKPGDNNLGDIKISGSVFKK